MFFRINIITQYYFIPFYYNSIGVKNGESYGNKNEISQFYNRELVCVWSFPIDEGSDNELILDTGCIYFEIDSRYLKVCDIKSEGKIEITVKDEIDYITDLDVDYKIDLRNFIINYPEASYYVVKIGSINQKISKGNIVCDAIQINIYTENYGKQDIFIHSGISGLRIGGMAKKMIGLRIGIFQCMVMKLLKIGLFKRLCILFLEKQN